MSLKTIKIIYRVATIALALFILPGLYFMNSEMAVEGMKHVWLTEAVRLQQMLWYASPIAILAIIIWSFLPNVIVPRVKEWAYAGLAFIYIGAFWAHFQLGDTPAEIAMPIVVFLVLMVSYCMWHRMLEVK